VFKARSRSFSDFYPMIRKLAVVASIGVVVVAAIVLHDYPPILTFF
jgi:predicted RND superfamily exporter protein